MGDHPDAAIDRKCNSTAMMNSIKSCWQILCHSTLIDCFGFTPYWQYSGEPQCRNKLSSCITKMSTPQLNVLHVKDGKIQCNTCFVILKVIWISTNLWKLTIFALNYTLFDPACPNTCKSMTTSSNFQYLLTGCRYILIAIYVPWLDKWLALFITDTFPVICTNNQTLRGPQYHKTYPHDSRRKYPPPLQEKKPR